MIRIGRAWRLLPAMVWLAGAGCGGGYQSNLEQGLEALRRDNYVDAVRCFERAAERNPQSATAYANLGTAYWKLGAFDRAIDAFTMAGDLDVNDPRPRLMLADVLQDAKRWDDARDVLTKVMNGLPERADMVTRFAKLEYRAGRFDQAAAHLENALRLDPKYPPALYDMAVMARDQRHDTLAAMRFFSRYLAVATDQPRIDRVHEQLAVLRQPFRPPLPPAARAPVMANATAAPPPAPSTTSKPLPAPPPTTTMPRPQADEAAAAGLLAQAQQAIAARAYDEALVLLSQARARDPRNADVLWASAGLYDQSLGQPQKAEALLRDFVRLFPDDARTSAARRRLERSSEPPATARATVAATTTTRPPAAATVPRMAPSEVWQKGLDAHAANDWGAAIRHYEAVLTLDPTFASAAFNLGVVHKSQGNRDAALEAFRRAGSIDPDMARAHYMVAVVAREMGNRSQAIEAAKRALDGDPNDHKTHYLLGLLYRASMRYDLARYHFKRAYELAPDSAAKAKARTALDSMPSSGARH